MKKAYPSKDGKSVFVPVVGGGTVIVRVIGGIAKAFFSPGK